MCLHVKHKWIAVFIPKSQLDKSNQDGAVSNKEKDCPQKFLEGSLLKLICCLADQGQFCLVLKVKFLFNLKPDDEEDDWDRQWEVTLNLVHNVMT